jgi:hypothetical protein
MFDPSKIQAHSYGFNPTTPVGEVLKDVTITIRATSHPEVKSAADAFELEEDNREKMLIRKGRRATDSKTEEDVAWQKDILVRRIVSRVDSIEGMEIEGKPIGKDRALIGKAVGEYDWIAMEILKESAEPANFFRGRSK